jgi:hypothetical protein
MSLVHCCVLLLLFTMLCLWIACFIVSVPALALMYFSRFCTVEVLVAMYCYMFNHMEYSTVSWYRCLCCVSWHSYLHVPTRALVFWGSVAQMANGEFLVYCAGPQFSNTLCSTRATPRSQVCRSERNFLTCTLDGHLHRVTYAGCCIDTIDSPDEEYGVARNM